MTYIVKRKFEFTKGEHITNDKEWNSLLSRYVTEDFRARFRKERDENEGHISSDLEFNGDNVIRTMIWRSQEDYEEYKRRPLTQELFVLNGTETMGRDGIIRSITYETINK